MKVFKVYFKIIKKNLLMLSIYIVVFLSFAVLISSINFSSQTNTFSETKSRVMIINRDGSSVMAQGLIDYLSGKSEMVEPAEDEEAMQDALFYEDAVYILTIPEGFSADFVSGAHTLTLTKLTAANSAAGIQLDMLVEKYLTVFNLYVESKGISPDNSAALADIANLVKSDLEIETDVVWAGAKPTASIEKASYFFKYLSYSIISIMILAVSSIMQVFSKSDLRKRMQCAPTPATRINLELLLGNLCFAVFVWVFMVAASLMLTGKSLADPRMQLMILNVLIFTLTALSLSFLLGYLIRGPGAQHAVANVVALGSSFFSGVFVPQSILGDTAKYIASFTPTYWYVLAVEDITTLTSYNWSDTKDIYAGMLIQLGFAAAFLIVALVLGRQKKRKSV